MLNLIRSICNDHKLCYYCDRKGNEHACPLYDNFAGACYFEKIPGDLLDMDIKKIEDACGYYYKE